MKRANYNDVVPAEEKGTMDIEQLKSFLSCGRTTAEKIGTAAGARIKIGKRTLWNVSKIRSYLDTVSQ